ncbi:hypothetical protein J5Y09_12830 [Roseomonas sp. PWR1]|uniref:DUF1311 domain-containing protein n=1 Tax=Roseomonas nitratireducens TaxID=2820810 RepID=A0ABS4ATV3_9PROT|nr:hypothetical protein [Neoroseomonas nitratireducens]MBP0464798.1 hypothetical protein [Neoroseomonas nitratireducens]
MTTRLAAFLALLLLAMPARGEERCPRRANVDCAGAMRAVDAAIAADPWLAILDQARAMRLEELGRLLDADSAAALRRQDATWRRSLSRHLFFRPDGSLDETDPRAMLRGSMEFWLMRLMRVQHEPSWRIGGVWFGVQGQVAVAEAGRGRHRIEANTADVFHVAWTCEYEGEGESHREDWLETADGALELRRVGSSLRLRVIGPAPVDYCGAAGSVAGVYFRIGDAD